jgi:hypothetical protein
MFAEPKLHDHMRRVMRTAHYRRRTEDAYGLWARQFILFHGKRHPAEMGEREAGASGIGKAARSHPLWHSFATHLLERRPSLEGCAARSRG